MMSHICGMMAAYFGLLAAIAGKVEVGESVRSPVLLPGLPGRND
jgi:hypothetical protein